MPSCSNPTKFPFYGRTIWRFLPDFPLRTFSASSPPPTHQHIARLVLDQKSASEAIQTFRWASHLSNFTHNHSTYRALIYKLCSFRRFDTVKKLLDEMPDTVGSPPDEHIFVTVIRGLGRARMYRQVVQVLDLVSSFNEKPSVRIFNTILDVLVKEDIDLAREFYRKKMAGSGVQGDDYTYGILMKGLCLTNKIGDGFKLLQLIKSQGKTPNTVTYNTLLHALCKNGKIGRARSLMNEMVEPNDVTFNILISSYCREENIVQALVLLENCFTLGFIPDIITVTKVVEILCSAGRVKEAVAVLGRVESKGGSVDVVAYNKLIKGFCKLGKAKAGYHLLEEMESKGCLPNVETYNILISGFCDCGLLNSALDLFHDMKTDGINWNFVTYDLLIKGLCSGGRTEDGFKILEVVEETRRAGGLHISPYNSLIYGLYKENRLNDSLEFLYKMQKLFPRTVDRSLAILGFCKDGRIEDAKRVYDQMIGEGGIPSALVYDHLIHGFCRKECVGEALELINEMVNHGFLPVASTFNALIGGFCRQGRVGSASAFMEGLVGKGCSTDRGSYNPLLDALCRKGDFEKAHRLFVLMVEKGILPDHFTWNSLLLGLGRDVSWLEANDIGDDGCTMNFCTRLMALCS